MLSTLRAIGDWVERADLGGWAMLLPGVFLVAAVLLIPAFQQRQAVAEQQQALAAHVDYLQRTAENYADLRLALHRRDPQLIQRLAWRHLNLKPAGARLIRPAMPSDMTNRATIADMVAPKPAVGRPGPLPADPDDGVGSEWRAAAAAMPPDAWLVRMATGPWRGGVLVFGGLLIGGGLLTSLRRRA